MASNILIGDQLNFTRMGIASVDEIKVVLADVLRCEIKPHDLYKSINSNPELSTGRHKLRPEQQKLCCPSPPAAPDYNKFDVSLLYTLIRNLCPQLKPSQDWGKTPSITELQIGDDIERLRMFRNEMFAHLDSSSINDVDFTSNWHYLEQIFQRMQTFLKTKGLSVDYGKNLATIAKSDFGFEDMEKYKIILEGLFHIWKGNNCNGCPSITVSGNERIDFGEKTFFEAVLEECSPSNNWPITWEKIHGNLIEQLDTSKGKYTGSSSRCLMISNVSKKDEGEYRAVISREINGTHMKIPSNSKQLRVTGDFPTITMPKTFEVPYGSEAVFQPVMQACPTPEFIEWQKSRYLDLSPDKFEIIDVTSLKYSGSTLDPTHLKLIIPATTFEDSLFYRIVVGNRVGKSSCITFLNIVGTPPNVIMKDDTDFKEQSVTLICKVLCDSFHQLTGIVWTKDNNKINALNNEGKYTGGKIENPSLTITKVNETDAGIYKCYATNIVGSTQSEEITLALPDVKLLIRQEGLQNGVLELQAFIKSIPDAFKVEWKAKMTLSDEFQTINLHEETYRGTTISLPCPKLVVNKYNSRNMKKYRIEVTNFLGVRIVTCQEALDKNKFTAENSGCLNGVSPAIYKFNGIKIRFNNLRRTLIENISETEMDILRDSLKAIVSVDEESFKNVNSVTEFLNLLQDERIFTERDVITMQYLMRVIKRSDLEQKCIDYATSRKERLCYFQEEKQADGCTRVRLHVVDDIENFVKLESLIETVAAIAECDPKSINVVAILHESSFIIVIEIEKKHSQLLMKNRKEMLKLSEYKVDRIKINGDVITIGKTVTMESDDSDIKDLDEYLRLSVLSLNEKEQKTMCTICCAIGERAEAVMVCKESDCQEKLCERCNKRHGKQRDTKDHKVIKLEEDVSSNKVFFCEICTDEPVPGVAYCTDCINPEILCDECSKHHPGFRKFRNHKMSSDLELLQNTRHKAQIREVSSKTKEKSMDNSKWNPCRDESTQNIETSPNFQLRPFQFECQEVSASKFSLDPENFHPNDQQHLQKRSGRDHGLSQCGQMFETQQRGVPAQQRGAPAKSILSLHSGIYITKPNTSNNIPGKPLPDIIKSDSVQLHWGNCNDADCYQMRFKSKEGTEKWKIIQTENNENEITIEGLMADTTYIFQVRGVKGDIEGPYGQANEIRTHESLASFLINFSVEISEGNPSKFELPFNQNPRARNNQYKTRQICLAQEAITIPNQDERTIMLVGGTGSGKSTLVDGIVNYLMGVSFEDPFRFSIVKLEDEERLKTGNQAVSQTEWITVYKIPPYRGGRLDFTLNIIDTPGFGDTRGIERDYAIVDQIKYLFYAKGDEGVLFLDSVCFIVKAPDARLTHVQKYIFDAIMSLFGKDIESNICTLITFADGADPPVLACLKEANLPFGNTFQFNNSALFAPNKNLQSSSLSPFFWEMGCKSFAAFFNNLKKIETKSLTQTKEVLHEREQLRMIISNLKPQIKTGLSKMFEMREQLDLFKRHKNDIENNKDFTYEVEETRPFMKRLPKGQKANYCTQCNVTCHEDCSINENDKNVRCWAMANDNCRICPGKCYWYEHKRTPYIFLYKIETVTKTYQEMKNRYEKAKGEKLTHEVYLRELAFATEELMNRIMDMVDKMNSYKTRLKEIALRPDPLSTVEYIDQMIKAEESEQQPMFTKRIKMLKEMKEMALVAQDYQNLDKHYHDTRGDVASAIGKEFKT